MAVILGGNDTLPQITLTQSQTFVPPQDGNVCIHVIGAGGGGQADVNALSGGGAGGYTKKNSLAVTTGGSFTVVVGVGGAGGVNANGATGGNSTVAGTGLGSTLTANGGNGGNVNSSTGGLASNGDVDNRGGTGGGNGGGGAVGIYAAGENAGTIHGGRTDAMGDGMAQSGYGFIVGGPKTNNMRQVYAQNGNAYGDVVAGHGGALCGGGALNFIASGVGNNTAFGGAGGIGGGGGGCRVAGSGNGFATGGSGGDGIVLIQYLPS